jgi:hypothetical protein
LDRKLQSFEIIYLGFEIAGLVVGAGVGVATLTGVDG